MQSGSLYFALSSASACITFIEFVSDCCLWEKKKINQSSNCQSQKTNSNKLKQTQQPNQQVGKNSFSLSCTYTQLCYLQLSVFIFLVCCGQDTERVKIPVIMELMRYIAGISSLTYLGVHLSSFSSVSPVSPYSELQLLCAQVLYGWQGVLSTAWAHLST